MKIFVKRKVQPSVEDIYDQIKTDFPSMSLATVCRNIVLIKLLGEVLELGSPDGSNRYDGNEPYPHPNFICIKYKKSVGPGLYSLACMTKEVAEETNFVIINHRLEFFGICGNCMEENA